MLEFERLVNLTGLDAMPAAEKVLTFQACVTGERRKTLDYMLAEDRRRGVDPGASYRQAIASLIAFQEPLIERQRRLDEEWRRCDPKGPRSALGFQPQFERLLTELARVGLEKTPGTNTSPI